ncbi:MAG: ammonium transporter, partial [Proteobacteria bacterium]|nr:ammonium transporter [Pseudomonadota bacterium]
MLGVALCLLVMFLASSYLGTPAKVQAQAPAAAEAPAKTEKTEAAPASTAVEAPAAADAPAAPKEPDPPYVNPINTLWVLVTAFLVFFMQAGFMLLEAGFARTRETINVLLEGLVDTMLCGILFYAWGFAWMFGAGNGFIGNQYYFLQGIPETFGATGIATMAFFL